MSTKTPHADDHDHRDERGHGHDHGIASAPEYALPWALFLTGTFMIAEAVGGWLSHSLALISDAAHMLTDTAALAIALIAIRIGKRAADAQRTFGYARLEILAAAFNAVLLFLVAIYILWEAVDRLRHPPEIASAVMMVIAALGLAINLVSMRLLRSGSETSLNVKGAYLEVWSDMLGSAGVLVAGAVIAITGWKPADPIVAVAIGLWVLPRAWMLLKASFNILLEGAPAGMDVAAIERAIRAVPGVSGVHDLHVWAMTSGKVLLTAHVERSDTDHSTDVQTLAAVRTTLRERFSIRHSTLQLEHQACDETECALQAPTAPLSEQHR